MEQRRPKPRTNVGRSSTRLQHWQAALVVGGLLILPVLTGIRVAQRWPSPGGDFYAATSQVIATLFIAIALEFFARGGLGEEKLDRRMIQGLFVLSWFGFFGCVRAMLGGETAWTSGLAAAGLVSASVLISLVLLARVRVSAELVLMFLIPPVLILVFL